MTTVNHPRSLRRPREPARARLPDFYRLDAVGDRIDLATLPVTSRSCSRTCSATPAAASSAPRTSRRSLAWRPGAAAEAEIPFMPARVLLQDFTGVPAVVDLAVMRDAMADLGGDPGQGQPARPGRPRHRPLRPGRPVRDARRVRLQRRARVRAQRRALPAPALGPDRVPRPAGRAARDRHRPPGQPRVPRHGRHRPRRTPTAGRVAFPDTLVGTDSHTTMVNGLGVLGYGVGGIEAEAVLLGQPLYQPMPHVVGVRLHGALPRGSTATDLVLVVTEMLRAHGVVGAFVEFAGDGLARLALADRATISNMSPEFGATSTLFPIDDETLAYLRLTGRSAERVELVERYAKAQGLWREPGDGPGLRRAARARPRDRRRRPSPGRAGPRTACRSRPCATTSGRTSRTASRARSRDLGGEEPVPGNGVVEDASAESFPASDPPSFASGDADVEAAPPADPVVADAAPVDLRAYRAGRDRGRRPGRRRSGPGRSRSRRSPPARTPRTRRSWSGPACWPATPSPAACASGRPSRPRWRPARGRHRLSRGGRADGAARDARASPWPATAARPASATPGRSTSRSPRRSRRTTSSSPRSCRATATSRAGSTRSRARATSPRRRSSSRSRWPAGSTST